MAQGRSLRRCRNSVSYLGDFCRAGTSARMPLHDPIWTKTTPGLCSAVTNVAITRLIID
jgi:hypothetical protein